MSSTHWHTRKPSNAQLGTQTVTPFAARPPRLPALTHAQKERGEGGGGGEVTCRRAHSNTHSPPWWGTITTDYMYSIVRIILCTCSSVVYTILCLYVMHRVGPHSSLSIREFWRVELQGHTASCAPTCLLPSSECVACLLIPLPRLAWTHTCVFFASPRPSSRHNGVQVLPVANASDACGRQRRSARGGQEER